MAAVGGAPIDITLDRHEENYSRPRGGVHTEEADGLTHQNSWRADFGANNSGAQAANVSGHMINNFNQPSDDAGSPTASSIQSKLPTIFKARYNAGHRQYDPYCLKGTRKPVLGEILEWAQQVPGSPVYWLQGEAGTGKSTIARTVCREFKRLGTLGASFFFSRAAATTLRPDEFLTTLASELAETQSPVFRRALADALERSPNLAESASEDQWQELIVGPLIKAATLDPGQSSPVVIVIDALGQCQDERLIVKFISFLLDEHSSAGDHLRVVLTSRPEKAVLDGFNTATDASRYLKHVLHETPSHLINADIRLFVKNRLEQVNREQQGEHGCRSTEEFIDKIVDESAGLFIYASTICEYVRTNDLIAEDALAFMMGNVERPAVDLGGNGHDPRAMMTGLDRLYLQIVREAVRKSVNSEEERQTCSHIRTVLGWVTVTNQLLSVKALAGLVGQKEAQLRLSLRHFHAVIRVPGSSDGDEEPIRLLHPSFREFLHDKTRCTDHTIWVDDNIMHKRLMDRCLQLMEGSDGLRKDICNRGHPNALRQHIDIGEVKRCISRSLQYACKNWTQHLLKSKPGEVEWRRVHEFLKKHLLHWLEAMAWLTKATDSTFQIRKLLGLTRRRTEISEVYNFLYDAWRFVLYNRNIIRHAPLQLYASALLFAPESSIVREQFEHLWPQWIEVPPRVGGNWGKDLIQLEGFNDIVHSTQFSPDGSLAAAASNDRSIKVWNARTGHLEHNLKGHKHWVWSIAISRGNKYLASASRDKTIRIWSLNDGSEAFTLYGHDDWVRCVAFNPDGRFLASGSDDKTVRIWRIKKGLSIKKLEGHAQWIKIVSFSPNGKQLASASGDNTILLWSTGDWTVQHRLTLHPDLITSMSFSSDSRQIASSSRERVARVWDTQTGKQVKKLDGHEGWIWSVRFSPAEHLLVTAGDDKTVRIWDTDTGKEVRRFTGHDKSVWSAIWSPDGTKITSVSDDTTARIWDVRTGAEIHKLTGHKGWVWEVCYDQSGTKLATSSRDDTVRIWDAETGREKHELKGYEKWIWSIWFSEDCENVATVYNNTIMIWDTRLGCEIKRLDYIGPSVESVCFSKDKSRIQVTFEDESVQMWSTRSGRQIALPDDYQMLTPSAAQTRQPADQVSPEELSSSATLARPNEEPLHVSQFSMANHHWIRGDGHDLLYLTHEYLNSAIAMRKNVLVIWHRSGSIMFLKANSWEMVSRSVTPAPDAIRSGLGLSSRMTNLFVR